MSTLPNSATDTRPRNISALILAAGKGTRMKSEKAKVLHEVLFAPMIHHVVDAVRLQSKHIIVVIGHHGHQVQQALAGFPVSFAEQQIQLGTAHAVLAAEAQLRSSKAGTVMILCGDAPLIRSTTLKGMLEAHFAAGVSLSVMTTTLEDPTHYGRILSDSQGQVTGIVEEKDATPEQKQIREVNAGIYCIESSFLFEALGKIGTANKQGEFYLTDVIEIAVNEGHAVHRYSCSDPEEILGVNSRQELALAHTAMQTRVNRELMASGVTLLQPESTFIGRKVVIGADTVIHAGVHLSGQSRVGCGCEIGPYAVLCDVVLADRVRVGAFSLLAGIQRQEGDAVPGGSRLWSERETNRNALLGA